MKNRHLAQLPESTRARGPSRASWAILRACMEMQYSVAHHAMQTHRWQSQWGPDVLMSWSWLVRTGEACSGWKGAEPAHSPRSSLGEISAHGKDMRHRLAIRGTLTLSPCAAALRWVRDRPANVRMLLDHIDALDHIDRAGQPGCSGAGCEIPRQADCTPSTTQPIMSEELVYTEAPLWYEPIGPPPRAKRRGPRVYVSQRLRQLYNSGWRLRLRGAYRVKHESAQFVGSHGVVRGRLGE